MSLPFSPLFSAAQPDVIISFNLEYSLLTRNTVGFQNSLELAV